MKEWINNCRDKHQLCVQAESPLPTRVLDLSGDDPVLVDTAGKAAPYTILSYCWGAKHPPTTMLGTEAQMRSRIKFSELPATFKDAITITRDLGLRYLWIDSLCIIQDSINDWNLEAAQMKQYYRGAYLTISALSAADSYEGILQQRQSHVPHIKWLNSNNVHVRPKLPSMGQVFENAILNKRGWTMQERLLSTRIIHFGTHELFWECATCTRREGSAGESSLDDARFIRETDTDLHSKRLLSMLDVPEKMSNSSVPEGFSPSVLDTNMAEKADAAMSSWRNVVTQYSSRDLSYSTDKLPAVSGLASVVHGISNYTYLAGCWKEDLLSFLWLAAEPKTGHFPFYYDPLETYRRLETNSNFIIYVPKDGIVFSPTAQGYRAPTWSWVSVEGLFCFFDADHELGPVAELDAKIVDGDVQLSSRDPFGRVTGGQLTISAVVADARLISIASQNLKEDNGKEWHMFFDQRANNPGISATEFARQFSDPVSPLLREDAGQCLMVRIMEMKGSFDIYWTFYLLLEEAAGQPGMWRRVGCSMLELRGRHLSGMKWDQRREFVII